MATLQKRRLPLIGSRTSLFANVAFRLLARVSPRGRTQCRCCRNVLSDACFPHSAGSTPAEQKRSRLLQNSIVAQLLCRARSPSRLSEENPTGYRSQKPRPMRRCVRKFGSPEVRKSSGWAVNSSGKTTKATLPTLRASALVRHDRFLLRPTGRLRRDENRAVSAEAASSPNYSVALSLRSA